MPLNIKDIEELKKYFKPKPEVLNSLPDIKSVSEFTEVYIRQSNGTKISYVSEGGAWRAEKVNANDQIYI